MLTLSKSEGIGGTIKGAPEDFVVEEITENGTTLELDRQYTAKMLGMRVENGGKFTIFVLQKKNWNTLQALKRIASWQRRGIKATGFAGTKDRTSISTQLCSIYGVTPEQLGDVRLNDLKINGSWRSNEGIKLGNLLGNRFAIAIRDAKHAENVKGIVSELNGLFPNYFGEQRFGYRDNNVEIGLNIIKGDFKSAAMRFLTDTTNEKNEDAIAARKRLLEKEDYKQALEYFPAYLRYERQMIDHLSMIPTDYAGALRKLPRTLALMFVHSVDSYIFNKVIEKRISEGITAPQTYDKVCMPDQFGFPNLQKVIDAKEAPEGKKTFVVGNIVGYDNVINDVEKTILEELGITQEQFKVKNMPELNCKGAYKVLFAPYLGFSSEEMENREVRMKFSLPSGSYATVLLEEFLKHSASKPSHPPQSET